MKIYSILLLLLIAFLSSCLSLYMPNVPNAPLLTTQGELHGSAHISLKGNLSFNSAYAVSNNFGVMVNGSFIDRNQDKKAFDQTLLEAAGGYFTTFGTNNNRVFEVYAGFGSGSSERIKKELRYEGSFPYETQKSTFDKYFVQVNYSSKTKKSLRLFGSRFPLTYGTALRMSYLTMNKFTINAVSRPLEDNIFLEPVFFTRMQLAPNVQLQYTSGSNFGLKNRDYLTAGNSVFTIGAVFHVGDK